MGPFAMRLNPGDACVPFGTSTVASIVLLPVSSSCDRSISEDFLDDTDPPDFLEDCRFLDCVYWHSWSCLYSTQLARATRQTMSRTWQFKQGLAPLPFYVYKSVDSLIAGGGWITHIESSLAYTSHMPLVCVPSMIYRFRMVGCRRPYVEWKVSVWGLDTGVAP